MFVRNASISAGHLSPPRYMRVFFSSANARNAHWYISDTTECCTARKLLVLQWKAQRWIGSNWAFSESVSPVFMNCVVTFRDEMCKNASKRRQSLTSMSLSIAFRSKLFSRSLCRQSYGSSTLATSLIASIMAIGRRIAVCAVCLRDEIPYFPVATNESATIIAVNRSSSRFGRFYSMRRLESTPANVNHT